MPQLDFYAKIDDHGVRWGDRGRRLAQWRRPVASRVVLDMLCWGMRLAPCRRIVMAVKMAHDGGTFVRCHCLFRLTNRNKIP